MIYREKVGNVQVEYEGTPKEIFEYFELVRAMSKKAVEGIIQGIFEQGDNNIYTESKETAESLQKDALYYVIGMEHLGAMKYVKDDIFLNEDGLEYHWGISEVYPVKLN